MGSEPVSGDGRGVCPRCGAALPAAHCPVCIELWHIAYLLREVGRWPARGRLDAATCARLTEAYRARQSQLLAPDLSFDLGTPAPSAAEARMAPRQPVPAEAHEPRTPSDWDRLVQATGQLGWLYAVGVLFSVAALAWLVIASAGTPAGRFVLFGVMLAVTVVLSGAGWFVRDRLDLRTGGEALLAAGTLCSPAALFAGRAVLGGQGGGLWPVVAIWATAATLAAVTARRGLLASQVVLANLFGLLALTTAAQAIYPEHGNLGTAALFVPLQAGANAFWAWRLRGLEEAGGARGRMVSAVRWSAALLAAICALMLLAGAAPHDPGLEPSLLLGRLLLGAAVLAIAFEADRPWVVSLAAAVWYLAVLAFGAESFGAFGDALVVVALLMLGLACAERDGYRDWSFGSAAAITVIMAARYLPAIVLLEVEPATAVGMWLLAALYVGMAFGWRRRRLLTAAVLLGTLACAMSSAAFGGRSVWMPGAMAVLGAFVMAAAWHLRRLEWHGDEVGRHLAELAVIPQATALLTGAVAWCLDEYYPLEPAALVIVAAQAVLSSLQARRREWLYLAVVAGAVAGLQVAMVLPIDVDAPLAMALWSAVLVSAALAGSDHWQPLEASGYVLALAAGCLAYGVGLTDGATASQAMALLLVAAVYGLPALRGLASRSHLPELTSAGARPWVVVLSLGGAGALGGELAGGRPALGAALVALGAAAIAGLATEPCWRRPARLAAAVVAGLAGLVPAGHSVLVLALSQAALLVATIWTDEEATTDATASELILAAGLVVRLIGWLWLEIDGAAAAAPWWLDLALAAGYLAHAGRRAVAPTCACLFLALCHGSLGERLGFASSVLWAGSYALSLVALAAGLRWWRAPGALAPYVVAGLTAVGTVVYATGWSRVGEAQALLYGYTAALALITWYERIDVRAVLIVGDAAIAYSCWFFAPPDGGMAPPAFGLRLALLTFAQTALVAALRGAESWRDAVADVTGLLAAGCVVSLLAPPSRPSVFGLLVLAAASLTAAIATNRRELFHAGFGCAWLAGALVLLDTAGHGRDELAPYRSLDLYAVPIGLYLLLAVERHSPSPRAVRAVAAACILGSLLLSAFAAEAPWHDVGLFAAIVAAVYFGLQRDDALVRNAGFVTFGLYVAGLVWRYKAASRWLLIPVLLILGGAVIGYALWREREERGGGAQGSEPRRAS